MILLIIYSVLAIVLAIALHEAGHLLAFRRMNRKAQLIWGKKGFEIKANYKELQPLELFTVYGDGVFLGLLPFVIIGLWHNIIICLYIIPYLAMCKSDIKNMIRCQGAK